MVFDERLVMAFILENAIKYGGKARSKSVLGKILSVKPEYRNAIKDLIEYIKCKVEYVNSLSQDELLKLYEEYKNYIKTPTKAEKKPPLPPLPNAEIGKVVTRFAPNPDFVLHLGSLRPLIISYEYAKIYKGRFIVRFEDTDPRTKKPRLEYYKLILDDIRWLGIEPDEVYYQSDRLELYYNVARELIRRGYAYICLCPSEEFSKLSKSGVACPHRGQSPSENMELFDKMLSGEFKEGEAVLRIKTDLSHPNPSVRDWPALRIIDIKRYPHPRVGVKYRVWPLYNFSCAIDDYYMDITHVFRGVEHKVNEEKQRYIYKYLSWKEPTYIHHGRLAIPGGILSKSKILKGIREGLYKSIDDPKLATVPALRRRGFRPEALKNIILRVGISPSNAVIDFSLLASENRKIVDKLANRYFGVRNPFKVYFKRVGHIDLIKIRKHPDYPERGVRRFEFRDEYISLYIDFEDYPNIISRDPFRLIGIGNFILEGADKQVKIRYIDNDVKKAKKEGYNFIHWVPVDHSIKCIFIYPDTTYEGYSELNILDEKVDSIIQFERIGYFRIEDLGRNNINVVFAHD